MHHQNYLSFSFGMRKHCCLACLNMQHQTTGIANHVQRWRNSCHQPFAHRRWRHCARIICFSLGWMQQPFAKRVLDILYIYSACSIRSYIHPRYDILIQCFEYLEIKKQKWENENAFHFFWIVFFLPFIHSFIPSSN